jgi:hypothetical protein
LQIPEATPERVALAYRGKIFKLQLLFICGVVVLYLLTFYLRYFVMAIDERKRVSECAHQHVVFEMWRFVFMCTECSGGYMMEEEGRECVVMGAK